MSLVGSLAARGLAEILQIISLSNRSGVLELSSRGQSGTICFRDGRIVRATATTNPEQLGELLLRGGLLDSATLHRALDVQRAAPDSPMLGSILTGQFGIDRAAIDDLVADHIERIISSFFSWDTGMFVFEPDTPGSVTATTLDPLQFMLDSGLNPYWLALEGSKQIERRQQADADQAPSAAATVVLPPVNIGVELVQELGEGFGLTPLALQPSPGLHLLRSMLEELHNPTLGSDVILLLLRFASEVMNRAAIFRVKELEINGLGQFGFDSMGPSVDDRVRALRLPTTADSLFSTALTALLPVRVNPAACRWNDYLFDQLGGGRPSEVYVAPLVSKGQVIALLYGDNLPGTQPIGDTEALEIFLSQAGLAMAKVFQERAG